MNNPAASWRVSEHSNENLSQSAFTPECFNRRAPVPVSPRFPLEAFGNDRTLEVWEGSVRSKLRGIKPAVFNRATQKPPTSVHLLS